MQDGLVLQGPGPDYIGLSSGLQRPLNVGVVRQRPLHGYLCFLE